MRVAGVMSGTSLDGIDVAVVEIQGRQIQTLGFLSAPYTEATRAAILAVSDAATETSAISQLNYALAELYARAVKRAIRKFGPVDLIGCHGQTVYHEGRSNTLQLGEPAVIAERTGLPVVSNFRARDIAAGGQGAPLVPYVDYLLFRHRTRTRVALNIGGIANLTIIPPVKSQEKVIAFDTGPGNMVIDALAREMGQPFDRGGHIAASAPVDPALLDELLRDPYYRRKPPKSAGREQYGAAFVARLKATGHPLPTLIATATVFTAATIAMAVGSRDLDLIISGGGAHNRQIVAHLSGFLPNAAISTSTDHGIDADAKEAIAFAVLAHETWRRKPSNLPSATGARRAVVLGSITP
jgi:anhydro-N-acetylmuramic acid kinase